MAVADLTLEGLVHDLNNVFQTIGESAELLSDDPKWQKLAHTLQRSVDRGRRIVHSILDSNRSATDLAPVLENAIQFCRDYLECANGPKIEFVHAASMSCVEPRAPRKEPSLFDDLGILCYQIISLFSPRTFAVRLSTEVLPNLLI